MFNSSAYCGINVLGIFTRPKFKDNWTDLRAKPSTQEQRDRLFSEMRKAGYEWDAEKRELRFSVQVPSHEQIKFKAT